MKEAYAAKHRHQYGTDDHALLYLDCRNEQKTGGWWWGWNSIKKRRAAYTDRLHATEQRVLDTIEWVTGKYGIDRNRVYLSGRSMGGSGSLGIGYGRGDIFAAILVNVPAGADHALFRLNSSDYPDPPPTVNTSSHVDRWARGQEELLAYCRENKLPMLFAWGTFGHASRPDMANSAIYDFPWLNIVRNEAYPVFTGSVSNDSYPGFQNKQGEHQSGQINAYYRWKSIADLKSEFAMELRLVRNEELGKPARIPAQSTANVTLRRLQTFKVKKNGKCAWKVVRNREVLQRGEVRPDDRGLLTIPRVRIEASPVQLLLKTMD